MATCRASSPTEHGPAARRLRIRTRLGAASACIVSATERAVSAVTVVKSGSTPCPMHTLLHEQLCIHLRALNRRPRAVIWCRTLTLSTATPLRDANPEVERDGRRSDPDHTRGQPPAP